MTIIIQDSKFTINAIGVFGSPPIPVVTILALRDLDLAAELSMCKEWFATSPDTAGLDKTHTLTFLMAFGTWLQDQHKAAIVKPDQYYVSQSIHPEKLQAEDFILRKP